MRPAKPFANLSAPFPVLFFASGMHALNHVLLALYFTLVLAVGHDWGMGYNTLIAYWAPGALLLGLGSPLFGWLGGRFGETRILILGLFGLAGASVLCGLAPGPLTLQLGLAALGLFGAVYHPVGLPWVVKHAARRGKAVASTGIAGSIGVALGPMVAGAFAALWGWRAAFAVPGALTAMLGAALLFHYLSGRVADRHEDVHEPHAPPTRTDTTRVLLAMLVTMTIAFIVNSAFGAALPKIVQSQDVFARYGLLMIGIIAGTIQLLGAGAQFVGGHFSDRGSARVAYAGGFLALGLAFPLVAWASGWGMALAGVAVIVFTELTAPVETLYLARYTPPARRGLVFGLRYGLGAIGNPAGVWLLSSLYSAEAGFAPLMTALAVLALIAAAAALFLPADATPLPEPVPDAAE